MADNFENMPYVADYSDEHRKIHAQKPWEKLNKSPDLPRMSPEDRQLAMDQALRQSYIRERIYMDADALKRQIHSTRSSGDQHFLGWTYLDFPFRGKDGKEQPGRGGIKIHDAMETENGISLTLESWGNKAFIVIRKNGIISLDGKELPKDFTDKLPKLAHEPYKEVLRLANFVNAKKQYPESDPKEFKEFSKIFYGTK